MYKQLIMNKNAKNLIQKTKLEKSLNANKKFLADFYVG